MFTAACGGCAGADAWAVSIWVTMGFLLRSLRVTPEVPAGSQGLTGARSACQPLGSARATRNERLGKLTSCRADTVCRYSVDQRNVNSGTREPFETNSKL